MNEEKKSLFSRLKEKLKGKKHIEIAVAIVAVVIMLAIYFSSNRENANSVTGDTASYASQTKNYCTDIEEQLTEVLSSIESAGKTKIIVNWESSTEAIIAYVTQSSANGTTTTPQLITQNGNTLPLVLKEIYPKALGVIIVCEGGDNVKVKLDIITAVSTLLDIEQEKVNVYAMSK